MLCFVMPYLAVPYLSTVTNKPALPVLPIPYLSGLFRTVFQYDPGFQDDPSQPPFSESDEDERHDTDGKQDNDRTVVAWCC